MCILKTIRVVSFPADESFLLRTTLIKYARGLSALMCFLRFANNLRIKLLQKQTDYVNTISQPPGIFLNTRLCVFTLSTLIKKGIVKHKSLLKKNLSWSYMQTAYGQGSCQYILQQAAEKFKKTNNNVITKTISGLQRQSKAPTKLINTSTIQPH